MSSKAVIISRYRIQITCKDSKGHVHRESHNCFNGIDANPTYFGISSETV
jgi:hypothetical protein